MSAERFVIIGGSYAAQQMAASARDLGFLGRIDMYSEEPIAPYQRPPLSKAFLSGDLDDSRLPLVGEAFYQDQDIGLHLGQGVIAVDPVERSVSLADGRKEVYDWLGFCTGARARQLTIAGGNLSGVHYLRSLGDAKSIRAKLNQAKSVCIIGGGFIGLEVASVCRKIGIKVTLLEASKGLLQRAMPADIAQFLMNCHKAAGVDIRLNCVAASIGQSAKGHLSVLTNMGDSFLVDLVVVGIGAEPNQALAEKAGVACNRGILVDACGRTSADRILAAGDCASFPNPFAVDTSLPMLLESIQATRDLAKAAGSVVAEQPKPYQSVPWFWSDQCELKLQIAGLYHGDETLVIRGKPELQKFTAFGFRAGHIQCAFSINSPADHMAARRFIERRLPVDGLKLTDSGITLKSLLEKR